MKKFFCSILVVASLSSVSGAVLAAESIGDTETRNVTVGSNSTVERAAYVHNSSRIIANDGTHGYTKAWTYSGGKAHYLKASIRATYSNGLVNGASGSNGNTSNLSEAYSLRIFENGPQRQYHSSSECRNTPTSGLESLSGKSKIFK